MADARADFTPAEIERARRYHRPRYAVLGIEAAVGLGVTGALAFSSAGDRLYAALDGLAWPLRTLAFTAATVAIAAALRLPLAFWSAHLRERRYGFSTQSALAWLADRAKALAIGVTLTSTALLGLVELARLMPGAWPALAAPAAAVLVVLLAFVAPVLLEPVFNRFEPLADSELADELKALSVRAGVPVRDVLVADASRRTRKENAYVSGVGTTRRVVLYDTLLARASRAELRLVTAHELSHRRARHVAKGTALAAAGAAAFVLALWGILSWPSLLAAIGAAGPGDPRIAPFVLFAAGCLELLALPASAALSRRWERFADRGSLELTGDVDAFVAAHTGLARANLSDLDPPRAVYLALFSHPTAPERIEAARRWAAAPARPGLRHRPASP